MGDTVPLGEFTTYLGYLVKKEEGKTLNHRPLYKNTLQISPHIKKETIGKYETTLTICCYFTRLNYEMRARDILKMLGIIDYSPIVFNKAMAYLSNTRENTSDQVEPSPKKKKHSGYLLYDKHEDISVSMTVINILGEKCIVVSFRGTSSIKNIMKDLNLFFDKISDVLGKGLFSEEDEYIEKRGKDYSSQFGAHSGFLTGIQNIYFSLIAKLKYLLQEHSNIKRIFSTGHSLGGAYANIFGMALAQIKKKQIIKLPDIHLITFGAPRVFTTYTRSVFNNLLLQNYLTLDRITNRGRFPDPTLMTYDIVPLLPFFMKHPGYSTLNHEVMTQSKTGRTIHISELRDELANIKSKTHILSKISSYNYNPLPDYPEFFSNFKDSTTITSDEYSKMLNITHMNIVNKGNEDNSESTQKVEAIIENMFNITKEKLKEAEKISDEKTLKEINTTKKNPIKVPKEIFNDMKEKKTIVDKAIAETTNVKTGGDPTIRDIDDAEYKKQTILQQPNQIVYSFPQATSLISLLLWHKKYMGILFGGVNPLNYSDIDWRGYDREAVLYESDGIWTYVSDIYSFWSDIAIAPLKLNASRRKRVKKIKHKTRRKGKH